MKDRQGNVADEIKRIIAEAKRKAESPKTMVLLNINMDDGVNIPDLDTLGMPEGTKLIVRHNYANPENVAPPTVLLPAGASEEAVGKVREWLQDNGITAEISIKAPPEQLD